MRREIVTILAFIFFVLNAAAQQPADKDALQKETVTTDPAKPKEKVKTKEILEYEKKYSKKKRAHMEREGKTSL